jgi:hypothetical protein
MYEALNDGTLSHSDIIIQQVCRTTVCKHLNYSNNLLDGRRTKNSNGIGLLTKVIIVSFHCNNYTQKERLGHSKPSSEIFLRIHTLVGKVVLVDVIVTSSNIPWQVVVTRQRTTVLLVLPPPRTLTKTFDEQEVLNIGIILFFPPTSISISRT